MGISAGIIEPPTFVRRPEPVENLREDAEDGPRTLELGMGAPFFVEHVNQGRVERVRLFQFFLPRDFDSGGLENVVWEEFLAPRIVLIPQFLDVEADAFFIRSRGRFEEPLADDLEYFHVFHGVNDAFETVDSLFWSSRTLLHFVPERLCQAPAGLLPRLHSRILMDYPAT